MKMNFLTNAALCFVIALSVMNVQARQEVNSKDKLLARLYEIGAVKSGSFKLKSGQISPIYFDLRIIVSYPDVLQLMADCMWEQLQEEGRTRDFDFVCGVPYTALPIATALSLTHTEIPMVMQRKEGPKDHGTGKRIEGVFKAGDTALVIEDVVTTGGSVLDTVKTLEQEGIKISHIIVCIDREQGGMKNVTQKGYTISALYTISEVLSRARAGGFISDEQYETSMRYVRENQCA